MSADTRVARAIIDVREQLNWHPVPQDLRIAIRNLIDEVIDALHLTDEDVEGYR